MFRFSIFIDILVKSFLLKDSCEFYYQLDASFSEKDICPKSILRSFYMCIHSYGNASVARYGERKGLHSM